MPSTPSSPPPSYPQIERRRRRRGPITRLLTAPIPSLRFQVAWRRAARRLWRRGWPVLMLAIAGALVGLVWARRAPVLVPQHRPEALCFALAQSGFAPPMTVEPSAAVVRGRFGTSTPATMAVREAMSFTDDMVIREDARRVGDYDVSILWLRLPGQRPGHWLVVAWMEGSDLAVCSFRFASDDTDLASEETLWGDRLLETILTPANFRAGTLPAVRLRGEPPRSFGPNGAG
jgi:hypothetical protein